MFDRLGILIGFSIVGVLGAGIFAADVFNLFPRDSFDTALERVVACTRAKNATACSRPAVKEMLGFRSAAEVMDALSVRLTPQQCHHVGHVVGQQSLVLSQDLERSVTRCTRTCDSACVHGAIGQAFAQELGLEDSSGTQDFDLQHLGAEEVLEIGKKLCTVTCHGVGHVLFQIYESIEPAIFACEKITAGPLEPIRQYCYNGVYMEYADLLSSRNTRSVPGVTYPKPELLYSFCDAWTSLDAIRACFRYFPRITREALEAKGVFSDGPTEVARAVCESYDRGEKRAACFAGIGADSSYLILTDRGAAARACEEFVSPRDRAACYLGQVGIATEDRKESLIKYCTTLSGNSFQRACFQEIFFFIGKLGDQTLLDNEWLCKENIPFCREGFRDYELDSWELIQKEFDA